MKKLTVLLPLIAISMCSVALAKSPFDGTWTLNVEKSQQGGDTFRVKDAGNDRLQFTDLAGSYAFKPDGSAVTTPEGDQQTYKKIGNGVYMATTRRNGLLLTTETWKLSPDGNTLRIEGRGTRPDGQSFDDHFTYIRTSAGAGLVGSWKSTKAKSSSGDTLRIQTTGADDVTLTDLGAKATFVGKWDGRDYPAHGPTVPAGLTAALSRTDAGGFKQVVKVHGKVGEILRYTLTHDGKSMVDVGTNAKGREVARLVWDKQS